MSGLPKGWADTEIGQIAQIETGNTPSKKDASLYGREVCFYKPGDLDVGGVISISNDMVSKAGAEAGRLLPANSLLVTCIGNLGKSALIAEPAICNQQINAVLPSRAVEPHYLYYWSRTIKPWLEENSSATTVSIINKGRFSKAPIRIAPVNEQRRIVAKIDSLTGKSRRVRDHLDHIPRLVEKYKQAILAAAFRGDLTRESRPLDEGATTSDVPENFWAIPKAWCWLTIGLIGKVSLGRQRSPVNHVGPQMRPYMRAANITWTGWDFSDVKEMNFDDHDFVRFQLKKGDVLINEGSGSAKEVGKPAIWNNDIDNCCFQNTLLRIQPKRCSSEYLYWFLRFCALDQKFVSSTQGVNIYHIGKDGLARFPIAIPPDAEQAEVVKRIEIAFGWIDRLAADAMSARNLIDHLDQGVLVKAFKGELVPQDSADEPASILLERIQAERAAAPKAKRGREKAA